MRIWIKPGYVEELQHRVKVLHGNTDLLAAFDM